MLNKAISIAGMRLAGFLCCMGLFAFSLQAQWSTGTRAGMQWSGITGEGCETPTYASLRPLRSSHFGLTLSRELTPHLALQTELGWSGRGFVYEPEAGTNPLKLPSPAGVLVEMRQNYIELPLLVKLQTGRADLRAYFMMGPSVSYAFSGRLRARADTFTDYQLFSRPIDLDELNVRRLELGGLISTGLSVNIGFAELQLDARYYRSMTSTFTPADAEKVFSRAFAISAGLQFRL